VPPAGGRSRLATTCLERPDRRLANRGPAEAQPREGLPELVGEEKSRAVAAVLPLNREAVSIRWRSRRTTPQKARWARLEDEGWTLAIVGRDSGDILVSASRGDERTFLRLTKDGTAHDLGAEQPIVRVPTPSIRYLSDSDAEARKLGY
jgi:hypothetical protein